MTRLRTHLLAACAVLLAATPAHGTSGFDGASASSHTCQVVGTAILLADGCQATYTDTGHPTVSWARVAPTGVAGTICGTFTVAATTSASASFCASPDILVTLNFGPAVSLAGTYTVSWTPGSGTPPYAGLYLYRLG